MVVAIAVPSTSCLHTLSRCPTPFCYPQSRLRCPIVQALATPHGEISRQRRHGYARTELEGAYSLHCCRNDSGFLAEPLQRRRTSPPIPCHSPLVGSYGDSRHDAFWRCAGQGRSTEHVRGEGRRLLLLLTPHVSIILAFLVAGSTELESTCNLYCCRNVSRLPARYFLRHWRSA